MRTYRFNNIVLGFTLFAIGGMLLTITNQNVMMILFGCLGWFYIIKGFWPIKGSLTKNQFSVGYRLLFYFYLLQCVVMIVRGYMIDYEYPWISTAGMINFNFFQKYYILPYLMPLVCFIPWQYYKFNDFVKYASWIGIATLAALVIFFPSILATSVKAMAGKEFSTADSGIDYRFYTPFAFAALLVAYSTARIWKMNILGLIALILINMIAARRGSSLITAVIFVASMYFWSKYKSNRLGSPAKIISIIVILCAAYFVLHSSWFDYLFHRGMQDSRSSVDDAMLSQMDIWDFIIGKGLNGRYYCPTYLGDYLKGWRYGTETGFYNIVLKGGYIMAFTYILLLAIPAYKGLFKSRNYLCKAGGFYILLSLLELYPFGWLEFSIKFLIIWMMVVLCMNRKVLKMDNYQIRKQFF